jgi:hypothetical protein
VVLQGSVHMLSTRGRFDQRSAGKDYANSMCQARLFTDPLSFQLRPGHHLRSAFTGKSVSCHDISVLAGTRRCHTAGIKRALHRLVTSSVLKSTFAPILRPSHALRSRKKVEGMHQRPGRPWTKRYNQGESNSYRIHGKDA